LPSVALARSGVGAEKREKGEAVDRRTELGPYAKAIQAKAEHTSSDGEGECD